MVAKQPLILVTGATGAIGGRVVGALHSAGYRVRTFSVDESAPGFFPVSVDVLRGDITDVPAVEAAMAGVEAVVHMAALLHVVNPPPEMRESYEKVNVTGTTIVAAAAVKAGVKRLVFFSTIAVYGKSGGEVLDETSPARPDTFYALTKLSAEQIVLAARGEGGTPIGIVLRLGAVYGTRIKGNYARLTCSLARGLFIPLGAGLNRRTLVYDKDVATAALLAVTHPAALGRIYNVTDGQYHRLRDIIAAICAALGRRAPGFQLPVGFIRFLAGILEAGARIIGVKPLVSNSTIDKYTEDIAVSGDLIRKELGFAHAYSLQEGWKETIQEMQHIKAL